MKWVSLLYVIVTIVLVVYDYNFTNDSYKSLVQYLKENLYFINSKIISSNIYINSINLKWIKYEYVDPYTCPELCSIFHRDLLLECIENLKNGKDSLSSFDKDFQDIILKRRDIIVTIFNTNDTDTLKLDVKDNLNFIITKGIKLCGNFEKYLNYYGNEKINMGSK